MNEEQARIRLAEAMGWVRDGKWDAWILQIREGHREICRDPKLLPDPFTDANDDYAVLEWMRQQEELMDDFDTALCQREYSMYDELFRYQIGDYARAALKVIDHDD